ncbi:tannase/feruloyl esterase family alpha/beta hydrolase [Pseudoduganella violacea]|uniref:Feruloyl esterase n=1 Tax=Pseudoduganella violacea TaxID=1715466 RepID=A0A7W5BD62_9BURK|nr:tannase/feruloyl esterase family alpha/beta hydrolase [Pseudoduganella violacea]MBB3120992.1 feruloyl esterase [Pseudoduganella violacea]
MKKLNIYAPDSHQQGRDIPTRNRRVSIVVAGAMALTLGACGNNDLSIEQNGLLAAHNGNPAAACSMLAGHAISASLIGLPTTGAGIVSASMISATASGNTNGEYCMVKGAIKPVDPTAPDIQFQLNIPRNWNHRALQMGGGGYNGAIVTGLAGIPFAPSDVTPLAQGYATYGSDSGHQSVNGIVDASFASNDEALINYGYAHIKKTHDAVAVVLRRYFGQKVDFKSYFAGASTGGRESLTAIQRFPADYDGAFVGAPTAFFSGVRMIGFPVGKANYKVAGGYLNPAKQVLVKQAATSACDALDGANDGIISNIAACKSLAATTRASLRCPDGQDTGDTCLSDAQLAVIDILYKGLELPYALADDVTRYAGYNAFEGADFSLISTAGLGLGTSEVLLDTPAAIPNGYLFAQGVQWLRYFVTRDVNYPALGFDPINPGKYQQRVVDLSKIIGASNPDLSAFNARGGKLILLHGAADTAVSPNATTDYVKTVVARMGQQTVNSFMRYYSVPGFGHGVGVYVPSWDAMKALDNWVTNGVAPDALASTDTVSATRGRSRPLCPYPSWPKYKGSGDINAASSFTCSNS